MMTSAVALKAPFAAEPALDMARQLFLPSDETRPEPPMPTASASSASSAADKSDDLPQIAWVEPEQNLWLSSLQSFGLTLMTFGVYHFWGRAEAHRRTTNAIRINGRPLDHTGTGLEAFISFAVGAAMAISVSTAFYMMLQSAPGGGIEGIRQIRWQRLSISLPLLFLLGSVAYRKRHHILRRTWLENRSFRLAGHAWGYALQHFWTAFLIPLTLGWAAPWRTSRLEAIKIRDMRYGDIRFRAEPSLKPLYKSFALLWFGGGFLYFATLIVLSLNIGPQILAAVNDLTLTPLSDADVIRRGLIVLVCGAVPLTLFALIYRKAMLEHRISAVAFDGGRLRLVLPLRGYLWMAVSNFMLRAASLGCFAPVAEARSMRYLIGHIKVEGRLPQPAVG